MTPAQRVSAVQAFGFTERQARFLVTAMLHGGVCVVRQYCAFVGIERGQVTHDFFGGLVARKFASRYLDAHRRFVIFHVHHKALYAAIGEPDSRFRKPTPLPAAVERLMVLDAVLQRPDVHVARHRAREGRALHHDAGDRVSSRGLAPSGVRPAAVHDDRYFFDKLPIGVADEGAVHLFPYLVTRESPLDFRAFLHRHAELLRALRSWRLWLLVPTHLAKAADTFRDVAHEELASPLRPAVADELLWFFRASDAPPPPRSAESESVRAGTTCLQRAPVSAPVSHVAADGPQLRRRNGVTHARRRGRTRSRGGQRPCASARVPSSLSPGWHGLTWLLLREQGVEHPPGGYVLPPVLLARTGNGAGRVVGANAGGPRNSLIEREIARATPSQSERRSVPLTAVRNHHAEGVSGRERPPPSR